MVRAAVLKNKDPGQIIEEMEKIDEMGIYYENFQKKRKYFTQFLFQNIMFISHHLSMRKFFGKKEKN